MKLLLFTLLVFITTSDAYRTQDKKIEKARKLKNVETLAEDESFWLESEKDDAPNIVTNEFDLGEVPDNAFIRLRRLTRVRIGGRSIRGRRILRGAERIGRRLIVDPVVRVVREAGRTVRRLIPVDKIIRFRRSSVRVPPPPPTTAVCRVPKVRCPSSWDMFDRDYQILDEVFIAPCRKYDLCKSCAIQRKWNHEQCLSRLLTDMNAMCVPYSGEERTVCHQEAKKFHALAGMSHKPTNPSPGYCVDNCVNQRGNPVVELSTS